jgi:hypothetical protein
MTTSESFQALRRANPRARAGFAQSVEATAEALRTQLATTAAVAGHSHPRRRLVGIGAAGASLAAAAIVAALLIGGSPGGGPGVQDATAAIRTAATVSAAAAERSGTAVVRINRNGKLWAGKTIRWHGGNLAVSREAARPRWRPGSELLVVDGRLYSTDPGTGGWVDLGDTNSIDPGSGTTPDEYLAAVREDTGGATLRRFTDGMTGLTTRRLDDGSTVYRGAVAAGLIARESGFKEGRPIRMLPFGYVAHDEAADATARLEAAITVGTNGIIREIAVAWGTGASAWTYAVTYSSLDATPALVAPANARPLRNRK